MTNNSYYEPNVQVGFRYFGHSSFLWSTPSGERILIDPYGDPYQETRLFASYGNSENGQWFTKPFPRVECDILLITHPHFDHDAIEYVGGSPTIVRDPLELRGSDFRIRGFMGKHAGPFGKEFGQRNVIFVIETAGLVFCHLGDNRADLPGEMLNSVENIDVLMVTVDDNDHLLSHEEVAKVISDLQPAIVMPTHYLIPGLTDPGSSLGGIEGWMAGQSNARLLYSGSINLSASLVPTSTETWVFDLP